MADIPDILRKRGIKAVRDNLGDQTLQVPGKVIWTFFGPELKARFLSKRADERKKGE